MSFRRLLPCVFLLVTLLVGGVARADDASVRAQDIAQMKHVWEALMTYKKETGKLPDRLGALVPKYLPNPKDLLSPRHPAAFPKGVDPDDQIPSSYLYEWGSRKAEDLTLTEIKTCQVEEYGPIVPLLRCMIYEIVLNISHDGDFYETAADWEFDDGVQKMIAKRGLGPGASKGKFLELLTVDPAGAPVSGVKVTVSDRYVDGFFLPQRTLTTGDDGRTRVPFGPVESMVAFLQFEKPGHFAFPQHSEEGFPDKLRVTVSRLKTISGLVTDAQGKPIANASVLFARARPMEEEDPEEPWYARLLSEMRGTSRIGEAQTDPEGKWTLAIFPDQPDLKIKCAVSHPDFAVKMLTLDHATVERDGYYSGKAKTALDEPFRVRGKVLNPDGSPAAQAAIFWYPMTDPAARTSAVKPVETKSNAAGEFEVPARVADRSKIAVLPKSGAAPLLKGFKASAGIPPVTLQLDMGRVVKGKAVNFQRRPVPDLQVLFSGWGEHVPLPTQTIVAVTDAEGNWTWSNAPHGHIVGRAALPSGEFVEWSEQPAGVTIFVPPEKQE